jgi:hypothetical protein
MMRCNVRRLCLLLILIISPVWAGDLVFEFSNPAFSGQGYSNHVLSTEQLRYQREQEIRERKEAEQRRIERELEDTTLNKFITNLESRIYATISKQMVDNMFAECEEDAENCEPATSGSTEIEGSTITWNRDSVTGSISLTVDGEQGYTEIDIPGSGEFNF